MHSHCATEDFLTRQLSQHQEQYFMNPRKVVPLISLEPPAPATVPAVGAAAAPALAPTPHLQYHGGPVIGSVEVVLILWGGFWTQPAGVTLQANLNSFFDFILTSVFMDTLQEYNTPSTVIRKGRRVATVNDPTQPGNPIAGGTTVSDAQIQQKLQMLIANHTVPATTPNTLYFVYLPPNTVVTFQGGASCQAFCGYHEHINNNIFYAVEPFITCAGCSFGPILDSLTKVSSHELAEAITDPDGNAWFDPNTGDEIGDICNTSIARLGAFLVQNQWSNARGACLNGGPTP
jgi:hypothetical protein